MLAVVVLAVPEMPAEFYEAMREFSRPDVVQAELLHPGRVDDVARRIQGVESGRGRGGASTAERGGQISYAGRPLRPPPGDNGGFPPPPFTAHPAPLGSKAPPHARP